MVKYTYCITFIIGKKKEKVVKMFFNTKKYAEEVEKDHKHDFFGADGHLRSHANFPQITQAPY